MAPTSIAIHPLTPDRLDDLAMVFRGSWGKTCWCMHPRLTEAEMKQLPGDGPAKERRRAAMAARAAEAPAPGLIAYDAEKPVG